MLILSRKQNQEIVFPHLGVRIEVARIRGNTVCLGIDAPKEIVILRGELENIAHRPIPNELVPNHNHELRNRLNAMSLCLQVMKEKSDSNQPIDGKILTQALRELHAIQEICSWDNAPNPLVDQLDQPRSSPFVMLIDAATNEAELLAAYLRQVGIQVALSSDGEAALNLLDCIDRKPGIILMDIAMPDRGGHSTLRALRENPQYEDIKIFAVTGLPRDSLPASGGLSVDRWFQKPIKPQQLATQIQQDLAVPV